MSPATYELLDGELHRHGALSHAHPHVGPHEHDDRRSSEHDHIPEAHPHPRAHGHSHDHAHSHGHSHGLVDDSIKRSRDGVCTVTIALATLAATAAVQAVVFALSGSLALLADLIHNGGDALTAIPLGIAFTLRSERAERFAGLAVVAAIFASACVAAYESILRLLHPSTPGHLFVLGLAGAIGFAGNWFAGLVRTRAGRRLNSPALVADGDHARVDAYVSLAVIASALAIAAGAPVLDPLIGLAMTVVILRITRDSWRTVRGHPH
jgi:divalent metal cation (Fe/Co/Zn/Cd) transporter